MQMGWSNPILYQVTSLGRVTAGKNYVANTEIPILFEQLNGYFLVDHFHRQEVL